MKLPHIIFYTNNLPINFGGVAQAFFIRIRPKYKDDKGLYEHEYTHVKQWYRWLTIWLTAFSFAYFGGVVPFEYTPLAFFGVGIHGLLYLLVPTYKLEAESEAYAAQVKHGADLDAMAYHLATWYGLNITQAQAKAEIEDWL
jgi:hypothetical protein